MSTVTFTIDVSTSDYLIKKTQINRIVTTFYSFHTLITNIGRSVMAKITGK